MLRTQVFFVATGHTRQQRKSCHWCLTVSMVIRRERMSPVCLQHPLLKWLSSTLESLCWESETDQSFSLEQETPDISGDLFIETPNPHMLKPNEAKRVGPSSLCKKDLQRFLYMYYCANEVWWCLSKASCFWYWERCVWIRVCAYLTSVCLYYPHKPTRCT